MAKNNIWANSRSGWAGSLRRECLSLSSPRRGFAQEQGWDLWCFCLGESHLPRRKYHITLLFPHAGVHNPWQKSIKQSHMRFKHQFSTQYFNQTHQTWFTTKIIRKTISFPYLCNYHKQELFQQGAPKSHNLSYWIANVKCKNRP